MCELQTFYCLGIHRILASTFYTGHHFIQDTHIYEHYTLDTQLYTCFTIA